MARRGRNLSSDHEDDPDDLDTPEGLEASHLDIPINDKPKTKDIWQRPVDSNSTYELPEDGCTALRYEIKVARIMPPDGEDSKLKRYVIYEITVYRNSSIVDPQPAILERRYTDFRELYQQLKKEYPQELASINFPNKVLMGNFSAELIAERSDAFESLLTFISNNHTLRESSIFLYFLQDHELGAACKYIDERRNEMAIPLLENSFRLLNKIFTDRSRPVLLILCRLVAACTTITSSLPYHSADRWASLALARYDTLCEIDLLPLYIPLLHTCAHLWWQRGQDQKPISDRLAAMSKKGINTTNSITLIQAIHKLDPRSETI